MKIQPIQGRVLSDGSNEIIGYKLVDYTTDTPHQHKERYYNGWDLDALLK
jgi:hypothetical protein